MSSKLGIIYCPDRTRRKMVRKLAHRMKLRIGTPKWNPEAILVRGHGMKSFLSLFEDNPTIGIFYPESDLSPRFTSKYRINPSSQIESAGTGTSRTAVWYAKYYNFPVTSARPTIAVISLGGGYNQSDLEYYWSTICGLSVYPTVINVAVGQNSVPTATGVTADLENVLDLEIVGGACPNSTLLFISAPNTLNGFMTAFSTAIYGTTVNGVDYQPTIISCSWGAPEVIFGQNGANSLNSLFSIAASRGIAITVATGDHGSSDGYPNNNLPNADFPSSSPFVIAVGGTTVTSNDETVWSWNGTKNWGTGSGISTYFTQPEWQRDLYTLPVGTTPSVTYLAGKRALPDIALSADPSLGYTIYLGGVTYINSIGGTSCAAPLMAALLGRMNLPFSDIPAKSLYSVFTQSNLYPKCYNDIVVGTNDNLVGSTRIWSAGNNFDLCSGMGSVNGANLYSALQKIMG